MEDENKNNNNENKLNKGTIINIIGWVMLIIPIFFYSDIEYNGDNPALQFIFAALPYILIGVGFLLILISKGQKEKISDWKYIKFKNIDQFYISNE